MTVQYSIQKMVSDGTLSTIALGIQYLQRNDIYMRIAGEETPQSGASNGYTWSFLDNTTLKISPVVPNGVEVVVYRRTDVDAMYNIYSQNAQFDEATIDENNQQLLYIAQEYLEQGLPGAGVDTMEFRRDDGTNTYYRIKRTDGSYSEEFAVPSASSSTKVLTREALRRSYAEAGRILVTGSFEVGGTLNSDAEALLYEADGVAYAWNGGYPKYIPEGSTPITSGGLSSSGWVSLKDALTSNGAEITLAALGWGFGEDISPYLTQAANLGFKKVRLGKGVFKCSDLSMNSPNFSGFCVSGVGSGFAYSPQTKIVPATPTQGKIFHSPTGVGGVDAVRFEKVMLDGNGTCGYGVEQLSGAGWEYEDLQLRGFTGWALWAIQGLNYYNRIYQFGVAGGNGIALYSDFFANNVETSGGKLGIRIMAGGGRLSNILSNSQTDCCIEISPLDASTTHINTAMSNIYIGEIYNPLVRPHLRIKGIPAQRVRDVQISNIHTVSAAAYAGDVKHNLHIEVVEAEVIINGWAARGIDAYETADLYDEGALKAINSKVILASGSIHGISRKPIEVINSNVQIGSGVRFTDWGGAYASGDNIAAVLCNDDTSLVTVADGANFNNARASEARVVKGVSGSPFKIGRIVTNLPIHVEVGSNPPAHEVTRPGDSAVYESGRRVTAKGTASTPSGGGSVFLYAFPSIPEDQSYEVTVQQVGNGANAAVGRVFINNTRSGVVTTGSTQTGTLAVSFSMSGAALTLTCGSGYGPTTWAFSIRRSM